jgi:hypothetical protein
VRLGGTVRFAKGKSRDTGDRETFRGESDIGMTFVGLAIALVGSILDYWGGGSGEAFTQVQITGYGLEMTGILSVLLGSVLLGLSYRHARTCCLGWFPGCLSLRDRGHLVVSCAHPQRSHAPVLLRLGDTRLPAIDGKGRLCRPTLRRQLNTVRTDDSLSASL